MKQDCIFGDAVLFFHTGIQYLYCNLSDKYYKTRPQASGYGVQESFIERKGLAYNNQIIIFV